jgi:hypothetical protein
METMFSLRLVLEPHKYEWKVTMYIGRFLGNSNLTRYHVNESTRNKIGNGKTMETMSSMRLVLEPYKYEWNIHNSIALFSVWRNAIGKLRVIEINNVLYT